MEPGLDTTHATSRRRRPFPTAATSSRSRSIPTPAWSTIERYTVVDDFGRTINPMLLEGQVHGGIGQGIGQALLEHAVYDESGQLLSGSFMDYAMPRAGNTAVLCLLHPQRADEGQSARRQGRRRGRRRRRAAGDHQCHRRRHPRSRRSAAHRYAGDAISGVGAAQSKRGLNRLCHPIYRPIHSPRSFTASFSLNCGSKPRWRLARPRSQGGLA